MILGKTEGRRRRGRQRMTQLDGITDEMNMNLGKLWETVRDPRNGRWRRGGRAPPRGAGLKATRGRGKRESAAGAHRGMLSPDQLFMTPWTIQHARLPCPSLSPGVCSNSCPLSPCYPAMSSSVTPFSCLHSFPVSRSFPVSLLFTSGGQSIGASASVSVLLMNIQS